MRLRAHWFGFVEINPNEVVKIDPRWVGGAFGCRVHLRDGRWFATSFDEAERMRKALTRAS
jgi:hypothetical protein